MTYNRPINQREEDLIFLYANCRLGITPKTFRDKWLVTHEQIAMICKRSSSTVSLWFVTGRNRRFPKPNDLRHLALMDFLFEHYEDIPTELRNLLCPTEQNQ